MVWVRRVVAFLVAVAVAAMMGAAVHSQFIVARMDALGYPVSFSERIAWTGHDIVGMFPTYAPIIAVAFLIALPVAFLVSRNRRQLRTLGYALAGAAAIVCALLIMKQMLDISGIAGARTAFGIAMQGAAGGLAGGVFARISRTAPA